MRQSSAQRDKTPSGGQKGSQKATAHSVKNPVPGKQGGGGGTPKSASQAKLSVTAAAVTVVPMNANKKKSKKKHQPHDLVVRIDLVGFCTISENFI